MTDEGYGRFGSYSRVELEGFFYLDDENRRLIAARRRDYNRLGFALQMVTVRHLGMFLVDPLAVPTEVVEYVADQLDIADPACVKSYVDREKTKLEHAWEIQREYGLASFGQVPVGQRLPLHERSPSRSRESGPPAHPASVEAGMTWRAGPGSLSGVWSMPTTGT